MEQKDTVVDRIYEEFTNFQKTMEELYLLKRLASDLRHYRKMIRVKKYD